MSTRSLRALTGAGSTLALIAAGLAVTSGAASAAPGDVDTQMCVGQPVWTGDLETDQQVVGLTTVEGNVLDEFEGSYVGTIQDSYDNDIHLFDLSGSRITGGHKGQGPAGIWSGISGSPVYDLDGNLVGSVSYSFTGIEGSTLAGVTPAANIFDGDPTRTNPQPVRLAASDKTALTKAGVEGATRLKSAVPLTPQRVVTGDGAGRSDELSAKSRVLADRGGRDGTTYAPASTIDDSALPPIAPGGNIATSYSYGQVTFASLGTVTAVCGDEVYAFGHPDEDIGESTQTILKAQTLTIVSDGAASYTLANIGTTPAGALTSDNTNGIRGTLGETHDSTPVTTHSTANGATKHRTTHVSTPYALPAVVATQIGNDAYNAFKKNGAGDADSTMTVTFLREGSDEPETFERSYRVSTASWFADELAFTIASDIETIVSNPFEDVEILEVDVDSTYLPDYRAYTLSGVQYYSKGVWKNASASGRIPAKKGQSIRVRALLKADRGSKVAPASIETTWKTSGSNRKAGRFTFYGQSYGSLYDEEFFFDEEDYEEDEGYELGGLDDLLDLMQFQTRGDDVLARYFYLVKKGKRDKYRELRAPGLVSGSTTVKLKYTK